MTERQVGSRDDVGGTMSKLPDARRMLEDAERAATSGEFSSADELLSAAARIQEAELGPLHPELANTLNSLAIVAERTGRFADAEKFYWRSATIAAASLPADHPIVIESRKNLEDFCRERGLPITAPAGPTPSAPGTAVGLDAFATEVQSGTREAPARARTTDAGVAIKPPSPAPRAKAPTASQALRPAPRGSTRQIPWAPIGAIVLIGIVVVVAQRSPSRSTSTTPSPSQVTESALPLPAAPTPVESVPEAATPTETTQVPAQVASQGVTPVEPSSSPSATPSGDISLTAAELCQTFSTSGGQWQCDPPGVSAAPGTMVFYTRVKSSRDATVVHRWYRDDMLRQAVSLTIRANASDGYRTYSRHTIDIAGDWRVEARNAQGDLLHERRFAVR